MILNMFDCDVSHLVDGVEIDEPFNGLSLTRDLHTFFGNFIIFFEAVPGQEHTYKIYTFLPQFLLEGVPITRTLYLMDGIDPPSPRLFAIHSATAHILHHSGAGEYIDNILRDIEETNVREDGTTELGRIVTFRFHWSDGAVA
jgi:hypothetical protein